MTDRPSDRSGRRGRSSSGVDTQRLNISIASTTMAALHQLAKINAVSLTEIVRRSIQLMKVVDEAMREGKQVQIRDPKTSEAQTIQFL